MAVCRFFTTSRQSAHVYPPADWLSARITPREPGAKACRRRAVTYILRSQAVYVYHWFFSSRRRSNRSDQASAASVWLPTTCASAASMNSRGWSVASAGPSESWNATPAAQHRRQRCAGSDQERPIPVQPPNRPRRRQTVRGFRLKLAPCHCVDEVPAKSATIASRNLPRRTPTRAVRQSPARHRAGCGHRVRQLIQHLHRRRRCNRSCHRDRYRPGAVHAAHSDA